MFRLVVWVGSLTQDTLSTHALLGALWHSIDHVHNMIMLTVLVSKLCCFSCHKSHVVMVDHACALLEDTHMPKRVCAAACTSVSSDIWHTCSFLG